MRRPLVSICIPSYNHAKWLPEAIESAIAQTYRPIEIVITDDGSSDGSLDVARSYEKRFPDLIRVLTHPNHEHRGIASTGNRAFAAARGEYWNGLPSDDVLDPQKIERQVAILERNPSLGWVYGHSGWMDAEGRAIPDMSPEGEDVTSSPETAFDRLLQRIVVPGVTVLARRAAMLRAGLHAKDVVFADHDLWIRLMAHDDAAFVRRPLLARTRLHTYNTRFVSNELALRSFLAVLDKTDAQAEAIGGKLKRPRTRAILDLQRAFLHHQLGELDHARRMLGRALLHDRSFAGDDHFLRAWLRDRELDSILSSRSPAVHEAVANAVAGKRPPTTEEEEQHFAVWFLAALPDAASSPLRRTAVASQWGRSAYVRWQQGDRSGARSSLVRMARHDAGLLRTSTFGSLALRLLAGRRLSASLRTIRRAALYRRVTNPAARETPAPTVRG